MAAASINPNPAHLRSGETRPFAAVDDMNTAFYSTRLDIDEVESDAELDLEDYYAMDEEEKERTAVPVDSRAGWQNTFGWDRASLKRGTAKTRQEKPRSRKAGKEDKPKKRRRKMQAMDEDLDAFNAFAHNGQTQLSKPGSTRSSDIAKPLRTTQVPNANNSSKSSLGSVSSFFSKADGTSTGASAISLEDAAEIDGKSRAVPVGDGFDALDVIADHIFRIGAQKKQWFKAPRMGARRDQVGTGVTIRARAGLYRTFPVNYDALDEFEAAMIRLNPEVALKIDSQISRDVVRTYM